LELKAPLLKAKAADIAAQLARRLGAAFGRNRTMEIGGVRH
jgi:hypothetical protein